MKARELIEILRQVPGSTPVVVIEGDDYKHRAEILSPYVSADGKVVIQFWPGGNKRS